MSIFNVIPQSVQSFFSVDTMKHVSVLNKAAEQEV